MPENAALDLGVGTPYWLGRSAHEEEQRVSAGCSSLRYSETSSPRSAGSWRGTHGSTGSFAAKLRQQKAARDRVQPELWSVSGPVAWHVRSALTLGRRARAEERRALSMMREMWRRKRSRPRPTSSGRAPKLSLSTRRAGRRSRLSYCTRVGAASPFICSRVLQRSRCLHRGFSTTARPEKELQQTAFEST